MERSASIPSEGRSLSGNLLTTESAVRTAEQGWTHANRRIKGPVEEPKEWTITSEQGETRLTFKQRLRGNQKSPKECPKSRVKLPPVNLRTT